MKLQRRARYAIMVVFVVLSACSNPDLPQSALGRACEYLWSMQGQDGGWHSTTHGILKGGESLTPFILWHLLMIDPNRYEYGPLALERGLQFLRTSIADHQTIESAFVLEYPNYAAAYALQVFSNYGVDEDSLLVAALRDHLISEQFTESRGITPQHPAYGGWGFGETNLLKGQVGHVDISHTRRILQALSGELPVDNTTFLKARRYLHLHQNLDSLSLVPEAGDGGFFTSVFTAFTNKSLQYSEQPDRWESYATATCDGLLGLIATGYAAGDVPVQGAEKWLLLHPNLGYPEGIPHDDYVQWHLVMRYYHMAVRAEAYTGIGYYIDWPEEMLDLLTRQQLDDGSFTNPMGAPNKEDDPLLATTFAVTALNIIASIQ